MSANFSGRLQPIYLRAPGSVQRGITVACPICRARPGQPCRVEDGAAVVHDVREATAFHGNKGWA